MYIRVADVFSFLSLGVKRGELGYLVALKLYELLALLDADDVTLKRNEITYKGLSAILLCKKLSLNSPADTVKNVLLGAKISLSSGAGYIEIIEALDGIALIDDGIDSSVNLLTVVDVYTLVVIDSDLEMVVCSDLGISNIPKSVTELGNGGKYSFSDGFLNAFLHFVLPFSLSAWQNLSVIFKKSYHLCAVKTAFLPFLHICFYNNRE